MQKQNPKDGFFFLFVDKREYPDLFENLIIHSGVCNPPSFTHQVIIGRNPLEVAPRCWQEILNLESHEYYEALEIT